MNKFLKMALVIAVVVFVLLVLLYIAMPYIYLYTENKNNEYMNEQSKLDCITMPYHCIVDKNRLLELPILKSKGFDIESKDRLGNTALTRFIDNHHAVKALLEIGANPNSVGRDGKTALALSLVDHKPYLKSAELLIQYGANVNTMYVEQGSNKKMTLLGYAISHEGKDLVTFLIKHGANPTIKDGYGYTACDRARIYQIKTNIQLNKLCTQSN